MKTSDSIKEIAKALSIAQGQIEGAKKDSSNPFFKSSYADLSSVVDAIRKPFSENGLSFTQSTSTIGQDWFIETMLMHSSGEYILSDAVLIPVKDKTNPQAFGSAHTYIKRYCLMGLVGIAPTDDDGNAAAPQKTVNNNAPPVKNYAPQSRSMQSQPPVKDGMTLKHDPPRQSSVLNNIKAQKGL